MKTMVKTKKQKLQHLGISQNDQGKRTTEKNLMEHYSKDRCTKITKDKKKKKKKERKQRDLIQETPEESVKHIYQ